MADPVADALTAITPPLLEALEALSFAARHLDPGLFDEMITAIATRDVALRAAAPLWPDELADVASQFEAARNAALSAFDELRAAHAQGDLRLSYRAFRWLARAHETLFPLATVLAPINRYFLPPDLRQDAAAQARVFGAPRRDDVGIAHIGNETGMRGGFSLYVPEYYTPDAPLPLVMALHGGAANGRDFLWSWLRDVRGHGAILVAPTASGSTWSLSGDDIDTPILVDLLERVRTHWSIDPNRILLTGMSDGGTFAYVSGLDSASPFTHLAPIAASFHPVLAAMAPPQRINGLPIFLTHGVRDWMFTIDIARGARDALTAAGADVTYREIDDLSHCYPREINAEILAWLAAPRL